MEGNGQNALPESFTADMKVSFDTADDSKSVNGAMLVKRDEAIRLQLFMPFIGSELMRTDFKKDNILIVDRMGHNYLNTDYKTLSLYSGADISFEGIMKFIEERYLDLKKGKQKKVMHSFDLPNGMSSGKGATITIEISDIKEKVKWDTETKLSNKYKEINPHEIIRMLKQ